MAKLVEHPDPRVPPMRRIIVNVTTKVIVEYEAWKPGARKHALSKIKLHQRTHAMTNEFGTYSVRTEDETQ